MHEIKRVANESTSRREYRGGVAIAALAVADFPGSSNAKCFAQLAHRGGRRFLARENLRSLEFGVKTRPRLLPP